MFGALLGMFMVLFVYLIGRRAGGVAVGLVAAALTATYPVFIYYAGHFVTEPIGAFWLVSGVLAFLWASDPDRPLWCWLVPGALFGGLALTRPEYLLPIGLLALLALYRVARQREIKFGLLAAVLFMAAFGLVLAPWTARNYVVLDRLVPVSTGGGKALFVATYYPGHGRQLPVKRALIAKFDGKQVSEVTDKEVGATQMNDLLNRVAKKYPELERDKALGKIGKENFRKYFKQHPVGYSRMVAVKMWHVWRRSSSPTMRSQGWIYYHYALLAAGGDRTGRAGAATSLGSARDRHADRRHHGARRAAARRAATQRAADAAGDDAGRRGAGLAVDDGRRLDRRTGPITTGRTGG